MIDERINTINTLADLDKYKRKVNEAIEKRRNYINLCVKADKLSKSSFGMIKESFEHLSPELFKTDNGKDILRRYMQTVKGNKDLSAVHGLYESVRKSGSDTDANFITGAITSKQWVGNKKKFNEGVASMGKLLAEACLYLGNEAVDSIPETDTKIDNAVMFIAEHKMTPANMAEYGKAVSVIKESMSKSEPTEVTFGGKNNNIDESVESMINRFNLKYNGTLSEEEIALIREMASCDNRKSLFEKYQSECVSKVNETAEKLLENGDKNGAKRLHSVSDKISSKTYREETLMEDVSNMLELGRMLLGE